MKKALSILLTLALALSLAVTALADETKTVTLDLTTDKGTPYTVSVTMPADAAEGTFDMSLVDTGYPLFTIPTGSTVEISIDVEGSPNWFLSIAEIKLDERPAFVEKQEYYPSGTYYSDDELKENGATVSVEMNNSGYFTPAIYISGENGYMRNDFVLHVVGDDIPQEPDPEEEKTYWWDSDAYVVYSDAELDISEPQLFHLSFSEGYTNLVQNLEGEIGYGGYISSTVVDSPAGTVVYIYLGDPEGPEGLVPATDFSIRRVNYSNGEITDYSPATVYTGKLDEYGHEFAFTLNEPGYYMVEGKNAAGYPWYVTDGPVIIHVTGEAVTTPVTPADVPAGSWFADSAELALKHGLVTTDSSGKFSPNATQSLSDVAAVLKVLDPDSTVELYTGADKVATREDMVVMFWKHAGSKESTYSLSAFADAGEVKNAAAWAWAVENGLIYGTDLGLEPNATLPKSNLAQLAVRYMDFLGK